MKKKLVSSHILCILLLHSEIQNSREHKYILQPLFPIFAIPPFRIACRTILKKIPIIRGVSVDDCVTHFSRHLSFRRFEHESVYQRRKYSCIYQMCVYYLFKLWNGHFYCKLKTISKHQFVINNQKS